MSERKPTPIRVLPEQAERVETGAVQFGGDWPGVFIRGDNAAWYAHVLRFALAAHRYDFPAQSTLEGLASLLESSDLSIRTEREREKHNGT